MSTNKPGKVTPIGENPFKKKKKSTVNNAEGRINIFDPHPKQLECLKALSIEREKLVILTVVAGRQAGKSLMSKGICCKWALENKNVKIWFVSPTSAQSVTAYKEVKEALELIGAVKSARATTGNTAIITITGTEIEFKSAASEDSLRGASIHYLILDEAAYIPRKTFEEIIFPTMVVTGRRVLIITTPKGKKNWIKEYFDNGQNPALNTFDINKPERPIYKSIHFTSEDNPLANRALIDMWKKLFPEAVFRQEILAEWIDASAVFNKITYCNEPEIKGPFFAGIDVAMVNDYTVIIILNYKGQMVDMLRFRIDDATQVKKNIADFLERWNVEKALIEYNNQGRTICQDLKNIYNLEDVMVEFTTSTNKQALIHQLINELAEGRVTLLQDEEGNLEEEFDNFGVDVTEKGRLIYRAKYSKHDDIVMASAFAVECYKMFGEELNSVNGGMTEFVFVQL